ncbi:hypothetical protein MRV_0101 [Murid herpesvirus 3]|uniref:Uncharacterized protein n=2 Tax=Murid betaherpesvirus 3 TaxID=2560603 RepID=A0A1P8VJ02_9BETA|nr:hypothetical protein MRV_0101 [Murine roseolovirus]APZ76312.1 hypothetical protein MRV_0101 [Murid betaherpesvirus 3]AYH64809.1 hypothetical protein MRV_0101 [Murid herpesvirus 3]
MDNKCLSTDVRGRGRGRGRPRGRPRLMRGSLLTHTDMYLKFNKDRDNIVLKDGDFLISASESESESESESDSETETASSDSDYSFESDLSDLSDKMNEDNIAASVLERYNFI